MQSLSKILIIDKKVLKFFSLRSLNQDHVENLNAQIRCCNGCDDHRTAIGYVSALCKFACNALLSAIFRHLPSLLQCFDRKSNILCRVILEEHAQRVVDRDI